MLAVCATPIGNLDDVTLRVLAELRAADVVLAEDTRRTRLLLDRHGIDAACLRSYHEHNEAARVPEVLSRLAAGARVALVSDAGLPAIADPGARLVRAARAAGVEVTVLPGPSSVETALVASGLAAGGYRFLGFLPRRPAELEALWFELERGAVPAVAFESPRRLPRTLRSLAAHDPDREVAVCRELTKRFEEVVLVRAAEAAERFAVAPRGEITLVLGVGERRGGGMETERARDAVGELVAAGTPRALAARVVAALTGVPRNELYRSQL